MVEGGVELGGAGSDDAAVSHVGLSPLGKMVGQPGAPEGEGLGVSGDGGEIVELIGIGVEVEELFPVDAGVKDVLPLTVR